MFIRAELKNQAKAIIKRKYPVMVLVCLIAAFLGSSILNLELNTETETSVIYLFSWWPVSVSYEKALMMTVPLLAVSALWLIFVAYPIQAGKASYFNHAANNLEKFEDIWCAFKENYAHYVKVMFVMRIRILLWMLLFLVPGLIKLYSYYFVQYLVTDYPEASPEELMEMSEKMTKGIRFEIFVLNMSFILWSFLAAFVSLYTYGLGGILLQPYISQTDAQLYHWAKENRLNETEAIEDVQSDLL